MAAGETGGDDRGAGRGASHGREETPFANLAGDVVVVMAVPERTRHAATSGVRVNDGCLRNAAEQRLRSIEQSHGLLMAVAVKQDGGRGFGEVKLHSTGGEFRFDELFEGDGGSRDDLGFALLVASQK